MQGLGQPRAVGRDGAAGFPDELLPGWTLRVAVPRLGVEGLPLGTALLDADPRYHLVEDRGARGTLAVRVGSGAGQGEAVVVDPVESGAAGGRGRR